VFKGKRVVLFAVPGAFTPTCSENHLPGYLSKYGELKSHKVDLVVCIATNDIFVMSAWAKAANVTDKVVMASDGNGEFVSAMGLSFDLTVAKMGAMRSKRFAMVIEDLKVTYLGVENAPGVTVSGVDAVLAKL
jgi:alkyl hydroperoxide reductase 1